MATHWLVDEGWDVPATYGAVFRALADHATIDSDLASRMASAAGLRNLIAHRYGALDWARVHDIASNDVADLLQFCEAIAEAAGGEGENP